MSHGLAIAGANIYATQSYSRKRVGKGKAIHEKQRVSEMANEILARQATAYAKRIEVPFEDALKVVLETEASRLLEALRDGSHLDERARRW